MIADISVYQGNINWAAARSQLDFVIFRASIDKRTDTKYIENASKCGVPFGVYHFCKAGTAAQARAEAEYFYKAATSNNLQPLFFVADIEYETQTASTTKPVCEAFADTLKKLGAKKIGLYISQSRYPYVKDILDKYDFLWIPRYGPNNGSVNGNYKPIYPCDLWQYTSVGSVPGIQGNVDLNVLNGSKDLKWFLGTAQTTVSFQYLGKRTLRSGMKGDDVKELQQSLNQLGYNCGKVDGAFGAKTKAAVVAFQKAYKLTADGIYGPKSHTKMLQVFG